MTTTNPPEISLPPLIDGHLYGMCSAEMLGEIAAYARTAILEDRARAGASEVVTALKLAKRALEFCNDLKDPWRIEAIAAIETVLPTPAPAAAPLGVPAEEVVKAALNLFGDSASAAFLIPVPNTTPPLFIAGGEREQIAKLVALAHPTVAQPETLAPVAAQVASGEAELRAAAQALVDAWPTGYSRTTYEAMDALRAALAAPAPVALAAVWLDPETIMKFADAMAAWKEVACSNPTPGSVTCYENAREALRSLLTTPRTEANTGAASSAAEPSGEAKHWCALEHGSVFCRHCDLEAIERETTPQASDARGETQAGSGVDRG